MVGNLTNQKVDMVGRREKLSMVIELGRLCFSISVKTNPILSTKHKDVKPGSL